MERRAQPNIILINCDDLGYGDLGCYGSRINATPHIDALAAGGLRCTDWYAPSPVCSPSRGATLTGCYPPRIHFGDFDGASVLFPGHRVGLSTGETTVAGLLRDAGYRTKIIGKWHCGDQPEFMPLRHGFDEYYGLPYSNDMGRQVTTRGRVTCTGFPYGPLPLMEQDAVVQEQPQLASLTERYTEKAVEFLRRNQNRPFFLYFAHMYVHLPHYAPEEYLRASKNGAFGACMAVLDWSVGVLRHELERLGLLDNTLIVFTSDNGSRADHRASNAPLRGRKGTTWEGGQRVPCIWYFRGRIPAGTRNGEVLSHLDFLPTLARLAGAAMPSLPIDGRDVSDVIFRGQARPEEENIFYYYWRNDLEAVRCGGWKLHFSKNREAVRELYNLREDIGETRNVYDSQPGVADRLSRLACAMREELGDARLGIEGRGRRPAGVVDNPRPLTVYDENHPYIVAMYDSEESG